MKELDILVEQLKKTFPKRLCSIFIFGSMANYGLDNVKSNVDLGIIISKFSSQDLKKLLPITLRWVKAKNPHPLVLGREEFFAMNNIYAIEYADIKWNYQMIYGEDVIKQVGISYDVLREQIIRELKHLLIRFRGYYLECGQNKRAMKEAFLSLTDSCLILFRSILRMQNITPSVYKNDLIDQISDITRLDRVLFKRLLAFKEKKSDLPDYILDDGVMLTINQLSILLQQIERM